MAQPLVKPQPIRRRPSFKRRYDLNPKNKEDRKIDSASLASILQLQEENRDLLYSVIALLMKLGLLSILLTSLVKLSFAATQRVNRHLEVSSLLAQETQKLQSLRLRFDQLFTIGGDHRLLNDQDQWIAPNSFRVIWR